MHLGWVWKQMGKTGREEVKKAVTWLKFGKAADIGGITPQMLKYSGDELALRMLLMYDFT